MSDSVCLLCKLVNGRSLLHASGGVAVNT